MIYIDEYEKMDMLFENGKISAERYCEMIDYLIEKSDDENKKNKKKEKTPKTRIGFLHKIQEIKKAKLTEYDGLEEIKEFVDKHYDNIIKTSEFIEKEPHKLRRNNIISIIATIILIVSGVIWLLSGGAAASALTTYLSLLLPITGVINQAIHSIIHYLRESKDTSIINNLSKIKKSLKKIDTKGLPDNYKKKISLMIDTIEDAEIDGVERIKLTSEAAEIYQRYMDSEITYTERDEMIAFLNTSPDLC